VTRTEVLQGVPVHLNCHGAVASGCLSSVATQSGELSRSVTWHFVEADSSSGRTIRPDGTEFVLTSEMGLIIMDVRGRHNGTFTCTSGGLTLARHDLRVLRKFTI